VTITPYQPHTTDATPEGQRRARNSMRQKLLADPAFAHRWCCHPERECEDGCDDAPDQARLALYQSNAEAPPGTDFDGDGGWTTKGHGAL